MRTCTDDPMICIDWFALFVGEFLKDGFTLAGMAVLLILLLRLRAQKIEAQRLEFGESMMDYHEKREQRTPVWSLESGQIKLP